MNRSKFLQSFFPVLLFTFTGITVMGYHPGIEDDGIYLAAVKFHLNPALYSHDSKFFRMQLQATQFDGFMAALCNSTHLPLAWAELIVQFLSLFLILYSAKVILRFLFDDLRAIWSGVALLAAMFTLPVAGTALFIVDQHLHPRVIATAFALFAVSRILKKQSWLALPFLVLGFLMHPIMGAFGFSFCFFVYISQLNWKPNWFKLQSSTLAIAFPLAWLFEPPTALWRKAVDTRNFLNLYHWEWYEWLGAIAPIFLFWLLWRVTRKQGDEKLSRFAFAVFAFSAFQQLIAFIMLTPPQFIRLLPLQPMRYLQLVYVFLVLIGGALLGKYLLRSYFWLWCAFLIAINGGMFYAQHELYPDTAHFELPGFDTGNHGFRLLTGSVRTHPMTLSSPLTRSTSSSMATTTTASAHSPNAVRWPTPSKTLPLSL